MRHPLFKERSLTAATSAKLRVLLLCVFFSAFHALGEWRVAIPPADRAFSEGKEGGGIALLSANGTTVTTNETEATPEIRALARALDNDPKLIFEYVRNHIAYDPPTYSLHNGANGCLMAGRGNDWDQAALLTSLLRPAGYTTRFDCGRVRYNKTDLAAWLGVSANAVTNVIPSGGNPCYYDSEAPDEYLLRRVWVESEIDGVWYTFDPAFNIYQTYPRPDLRGAMGYTESAFLSSATVGATLTADYMSNVNETNMSASLTVYATNLVRFIQTNNPLMSVEELIGGRRMVFETLTNYPTSLPKAISVDASDTWDQIPSTNNVTLSTSESGILTAAARGAIPNHTDAILTRNAFRNLFWTLARLG